MNKNTKRSTTTKVIMFLAIALVPPGTTSYAKEKMNASYANTTQLPLKSPTLEELLSTYVEQNIKRPLLSIPIPQNINGLRYADQDKPTEADVEIEVESNGSVSSKLSDPSDFPELDRNIQNTLNKFKQLKPFPKGFPASIEVSAAVTIGRPKEGLCALVSIEEIESESK